MEDNNQKEKLKKIIEESDEYTESGLAKKIDYKKLERVSKRLIQFYDECNECQQYTEFIIKYAADTNKFSKIENKNKLHSFKNKMKDIISHMKNKHDLIADGQYMSTYMCLGTGVGIALGTAFDNVSIGLSLGICFGLAIGAGIDAYYKKNGRVL
ncbi:MAG: hypothetical protein ACOCRZ_06285 [Halothermotrichaceae bacterium]